MPKIRWPPSRSHRMRIASDPTTAGTLRTRVGRLTKHHRTPTPGAESKPPLVAVLVVAGCGGGPKPPAAGARCQKPTREVGRAGEEEVGKKDDTGRSTRRTPRHHI